MKVLEMGRDLKKLYVFLEKILAHAFLNEKIEEVETLEKSELEVDLEVALLYERIYFDSLDTREKLGLRVQVPVAILISLGGAQSFMLLATGPIEAPWIYGFFALFLALAFCFILMSFYYFLKVMSGQSYRYIPTLVQFEKYRRETIEEYKKAEGAEKWLKNWVKMAVKEEIVLQMAHCASHNVLRNDLRSKYSSKGHKLLVCSAIFTGMSFCFFHFGGLREKPVHKVQLLMQNQTSQGMSYNMVKESLHSKKNYFYETLSFRSLND